MNPPAATDFLKGQFLMAMPSLDDPYFARSVICLSEHNDNGAFGLVVNKVHALLKMPSILEELQLPCSGELAEAPVYVGGPVHVNEIFILHEAPFEWQGTLMISDRLAMSNTIDLLKAIVAGSGPRRYLIAMGCSGWGPGQLEMEMRENAWLSSPVSDDILFEVSIEERWEQAVRKMGINPALLSGAAGHA